MDRKKLPIGISDYKLMISEDYYYVDKTDFIRQIVEEGSLITLLPRPRRFGKTLNLSTLRYFFEKTEGNKFRPLFKEKKIEEWKDFDKYQGKYPVIMITLKDCKGDTFEETLMQIGIQLQQEFERHRYLSDDQLSEINREWFDKIYRLQADSIILQNSLRLLSDLLTAHWGIPPLVLLDEYDTPIHVAFDKGYYDKMIGFMRNLMSTVFKDNTDIFRGVITGILRVSKESIFSGLNNIAVFSLLDRPMCTSFGFTQEETDRMLDDYSFGTYKEEVKQWYDGYLFGGKTVYNPWSVLNFIMYNGVLAPYWVNTGSDVLLRHLLADGPSQIREGIEALIQGDPLRSVINDKLAFPDLLAETFNIWSFMLFSGYLKAYDPVKTGDDLTEYTLQVPNREVRTVFFTIIRSWINNSPVKNERLELMLRALDENNMPIFRRLLNDFVVNSLSYYDTSGRDPEKVYQAFLLGLLVSNSAYEVSSNRESGLGRYDILLRPRDLSKRGIIIELKLYDPLYDESVEAILDSALRQIEDKQYAATLRQAGVGEILKMAITFDGKQVYVKTVE
ncbi:AAA family ATPase [Parabacteroides chongii]|uniref:AAA family ATPase n=1 Tax=Parabacteroides chongii TaxID=2685834 RepID=UPI00240D9A98|nr:AAA family ATPase [Parabacteroides chongii]WFE84243.1 AAA family ATPase [Parabacteroides chongii]